MVLGIYGSGGLGRVIYDSVISSQCNKWEKIVFINDYEEEDDFYGTHRYHFESLKKIFKNEIEIIIAVGEPETRKTLYEKVKQSGFELANYIDERAIISESARIGEGVYIAAFCVIDSGSNIADNVVVEAGCVIGHDVKIGNHSVISVHSVIGGWSVIDELVFIGLQSIIKDRLVVGKNAIVSMGSVVYRNVIDSSVVIGNPARETRGSDEHKVFK